MKGGAHGTCTHTPHQTVLVPEGKETHLAPQKSPELLQMKADTLVNTSIFRAKVTLVCLFDDHAGPEEHKSHDSNNRCMNTQRDRYTANCSSSLESDLLQLAP